MLTYCYLFQEGIYLTWNQKTQNVSKVISHFQPIDGMCCCKQRADQAVQGQPPGPVPDPGHNAPKFSHGPQRYWTGGDHR